MYLSAHTLVYSGTYINGKGKKKQTTRHREATVGSTKLSSYQQNCS